MADNTVAELDQILSRFASTRCETKEPLRMMTVRMPAALYETLKAEARLRNMSANRLAVAKLFVPASILTDAVEAAKKEHSVGREQF